MDNSPKYMFDTNVFNRILDGVISLQTLTGRVVAHATHIQRDEINNTKTETDGRRLRRYSATSSQNPRRQILSSWGFRVLARLI